MTSDKSPMPEYPWLFNGEPNKPSKKGLALLTYVQWLGSWLESYPHYEGYTDSPVKGITLEAAATPDATAAKTE